VKKPTRKPIFDDRSRFLDRFGTLLVVTAGSIVVLSLIDIGPTGNVAERWASAVASLLVGTTLLLALRASGLTRRLQRIADLVVILLVVSVGVLAVGSTFLDTVLPSTTAAPWAVVVLAFAAPMAVVRRLVQHREVTRGTLLGAVSGYLLLPIAFFYAFVASTAWQAPFFASPEPSTTYMYFSLSTITTTGYGDLTASHPFGRLLSMAEAVTGQVYLVTFVAMLVGLFAASRLQGREPRL
jgi:hypothetical protein